MKNNLRNPANQRVRDHHQKEVRENIVRRAGVTLSQRHLGEIAQVSMSSRTRVRTGPGNPGKSLNFRKSFSRPGKSWNSDAGPGKSWKTELSLVFS